MFTWLYFIITSLHYEVYYHPFYTNLKSSIRVTIRTQDDVLCWSRAWYSGNLGMVTLVRFVEYRRKYLTDGM